MSRPVSLYAAGLTCAAGTTLAAVTAAYVENDHQQQKERTLVRTDGAPVVLACVHPLSELPDYTDRLMTLIGAAFEQSAAQLGDQSPPPVWLLLPAWMKGSEVLAALKQRLVQTPLAAGGPISILLGDHAEGLIALAEGMRVVGDGEHDAIMMVAVDSRIHADLIDRLDAEGRVRTKLQPHGLIPGEAAVAFVLGAVETMGALRPMGRVAGFKSAREDEDIREPQGLIGRGLAECFRFAAETFAPNRLLVDLNGERYRAEEFGFAVASASPAFSDLAANPETPAFLFGDLGAATGPFLTALALGPRPASATAFRQEGDPDLTLVSASSYQTGRRAVAVIERLYTSRSPEEG